MDKDRRAVLLRLPQEVADKWDFVCARMHRRRADQVTAWIEEAHRAILASDAAAAKAALLLD